MVIKSVNLLEEGQSLAVRFWDEDGKYPDLKTPPFEHYAPILQRVVERFTAVQSQAD